VNHCPRNRDNCDDCEIRENCEGSTYNGPKEEPIDEKDWIRYLTGRKFYEGDDLSGTIVWSEPEFPGDCPD
jgi:hypothetical protein